MGMQVLSKEEINEVSGGAITVGGPGLSFSLDPFALVGGLLNGVMGLVGSLLTALGSLPLLGGLLAGL